MSYLAISHVINSSMSWHIYLVKMIVERTCVKIILQIMSSRWDILNLFTSYLPSKSSAVVICDTGFSFHLVSSISFTYFSSNFSIFSTALRAPSPSFVSLFPQLPFSLLSASSLWFTSFLLPPLLLVSLASLSPL